MTRLVGGLIAIMLVLVPLEASGSMPFAQMGPEASLVCTYPGRTFGYWKDGEVLTGVSDPSLEQEAFTLRISSIDIYEGRAWFVSDWEEHGILILDTINSLTFLDASPMGVLRVITVYPHFCPDRKAYCSVMSEHMRQAGNVAPVQMFGFCKLK